MMGSYAAPVQLLSDSADRMRHADQIMSAGAGPSARSSDSPSASRSRPQPGSAEFSFDPVMRERCAGCEVFIHPRSSRANLLREAYLLQQLLITRVVVQRVESGIDLREDQI